MCMVKISSIALFWYDIHMKTAIVDEYNDPRLALLYDDLNKLGDDSKFYLQLANRLSPMDVIDLGCGTGLLTIELAKKHRTIGVEPSKAMLDLAKQQPGADDVVWLQGDATDLSSEQADLVIMTGHTAQVFLNDYQWKSNLTSIHKSLRAGGYLAFESRNPEAKAWETWNKESSSREFFNSELGKVTAWNELKGMDGKLARFDNHYILHDADEELIAECEIRFQSQDELELSLANAGFVVEHIYNDWNGTVVNGIGRELIFISRRR